MGATHATAYRDNGAVVAAICDVDEQRGNSLAAAFGADAFTDAETMLDAVRLQALSICTPPVDHVSVALAAVRRGIPILVEKPLAESLEAADVIRGAVEASGVPCMVGFCHRFHEPVLQIKRLLDAGEIGAPVFFRNRFAYQFEDVEQSWFSNPRIAGGGTLMDTSVHSIDLYRFLIGEIAQVTVQVGTQTVGLPVEDNSILLVNGPTGVPGVIEASWTTPIGESVLTIYGTKGNLMVNYGLGDFGVAFIHREGEEGPTEIPRTGLDRFTVEVAHFLGSTRRGQQPTPGVGDGFRTLEIIDAAYKQVGKPSPVTGA